LGQGLELALACDLRIAVNTAHFSIPHIDAGFIPWDGATQRLPRLVRIAVAMDMVLTGKVIDAKEAFRIGLVNKLVPSGKLTSIVDEISQTMASKSPLALNSIKEATNKGLDMTLEQGLHLESDLYLLLQTTEDRIEGVKAFLEKRQPRFKGK
jgi:enoyl-CoA hydratase/carnithine racemase